VHVEYVLGGEMAGVVGQGGLLAEALKQLNVGEAVGKAGRIAQGDLGPGDVVGAVEGEESGEADSVGEVREVLELAELGEAVAVPLSALCLLVLQLYPANRETLKGGDTKDLRYR